ncbi:uncharacterized protein [Rutidosis leptorrhynchoides]|uniref:uncharacterized protein n=1 Tax=Rutidosis leptorrhynchoides TaxID=125765 RepID=UPI003A99F731
MADTFASPKQPSLFPISFSTSISKQDYLLFYKNERSLFTLLLVVLHRDAVQSIFAIGFLIWLEREGYTLKNLAEIIVNTLTPDVINQVVNQILTCLKLLHKETNSSICDSNSGRYDISLLQSFLDRKLINLKVLYYNGDSIFDEVSNIANEVSKKAFDDILEQFINRRNVGGFGVVPFKIKDSEDAIPPEDRTIFLTFSKGYPISESEVREYFTSMFGDFIESIHMQMVEPENQSLFARIVARRANMVKEVVERDGPLGKSKYNINGKHVWARKYVKRKPTKDMGECVASPQRHIV